MNELIFFGETATIILFSFLALKLGKEALITWITLQALVANLFVVKQIHLFGLQVTASDAFAIGSLLGLNFLQEFYGREAAKKSTWICFSFMTFFAIVSQLHIHLQPSEDDIAHEAFLLILSPTLRLLMASLSVFFIVQQVDIRFFSFLKEKLNAAPFALRATLSLFIAQTLDTILFSYAGLYGIVSSMLDIIVMSLIIKWVVISCFTLSMRLAKL